MRVWCRVYPSSHPQSYFPYVIRLRLMVCLRRKPYRLASEAFRSTCVYKVHVFRIRRGSVTHPILRVFVCLSAKVLGTIKSVVPSGVRSTSSVKVTSFLTSTFNVYYSTQFDSYFFIRYYLRSTINVSLIICFRRRSGADPIRCQLLCF